VFFINAQGATNGTSYPQETVAAQAAVQYINKNLGGVAGHPIKLDTCFSDDTPAGTTTCANQAVAANPIAVTIGTLGTDSSVIDVTSKTNIPVVSNYGASQQILTAKGKAFIINSYGEAAVLGELKVMQQQGIKSAAAIYDNVPSVASGIWPVTQQAAKTAGIQIKGYPVPYPSPDLTPTVQVLTQSNPGALLLISDPTTCSAAYQASRSLSFTSPIFSPIPCQNSANGNLVGQLPQKVYLQQTFQPLSDTSDPDVATYLKAMSAAGAPTATTNTPQAIAGFQDLMDVYAALKAAAKDGTPTIGSLKQVLQTQSLHQFMLGSKATYTCDGKLLPALPSVCSFETLIGTWKGSSVTDVQLVDGSSLIK
jgi:branched-chain amino acid transport system substrate-binding protein